MKNQSESESLQPPTLEDVIAWQKKLRESHTKASARIYDNRINWSKWVNRKNPMHPAFRELYVRKARRAWKRREEKAK